MSQSFSHSLCEHGLSLSWKLGYRTSKFSIFQLFPVSSLCTINPPYLCTIIFFLAVSLLYMISVYSHETLLTYLLLSNEPSIIKLSSIKDTISEVSPPLRSSSPRFLKFANENTCVLHSDTTPFSLKSMSRSFTAAIQTS